MALLRDAPAPTDRSPTSAAAKTALAVSSLALLLSGLAVVQGLEGDDERRELDRRIACLEKDGANDCGADGR
jgi:hypothetical protein